MGRRDLREFEHQKNTKVNRGNHATITPQSFDFTSCSTLCQSPPPPRPCLLIRHSPHLKCELEGNVSIHTRVHTHAFASTQ
jgi:hypothetical protein